MHWRIVLFVLISLFSIRDIRAQQRVSVSTKGIGSPNTGAATFYHANRSEPPRAIEFQERSVTVSSFLANINQYFSIPVEFTFTETESTTDDLGMRHLVLQQHYKGIPLEGMGYRVHEKDGFIRSANGKAVRNINLDTLTAISEEQALHLALQHVNSRDTTLRIGKKLIVSKNFSFAPSSFFVAFQFDIDVSLIERWRISIDARTGDVINKVSLVNTCFKDNVQPLPYGTGTGLTNYYGHQTIQVEQYGNGASRLVGQTENGVTIGTYDYRNVSVLALLFGFYDKFYDFYSANNIYNNPYQKPAVSVQWAAEQACEYYFRKHNRNSFDNKGGAIKSYVHVDVNMNNAFWTGKVLAFGDGSDNNPLVELDVVGHELTHGVTQHEARLQYSYEPGALNESFSDIFGKAAEFDVFGDSATWQLARRYRNGGLRDFSNPNLKDQPDTYLGQMWHTGYEDNGGVHYNSGVQNFWFYLLCEGGTGINDNDVSYSVNAIGMDAAARIAYRNLTEYLNYFSDYLDSRIGSLLATADLYGKNSAAYQEVDKAWDAVGVIDEPIITSLELYDITATTVKFRGSLLPRGDTVTYLLEYGTTPNFGSSSSVYKYTDAVAGILTGLQSETKYYLRLVATNENGSSYYPSEFTTISLAPMVKIKQTVDVTETTATLHGQINPNSLATSFHFEYGTSPSLGLITPTYPLSDTTEFMNVSAPVVDLQPRRTYYYRLVATNGFASSATESAHFFTAVKPVIASYSPGTAPIGTELIITGQNFNPIPENNLVSFGATRSVVLSSNSTAIKVKVPAGASLAPISVHDVESGLIGESVQEFVPTFTGGFKRGDLQLTMGSTDYIYQTLVQDMDGDNKPDIIARHYLGFSVFQNVNQGGDVTDESFVRNTFNSEHTPGTLSLVDFDGNGLKDLVGMYQNALRVYPNFSVPGFIFFQAPVDLSLGYFTDMTFNDFDQDGHIDIAVLGYLPGDSSMVTIFRNQNPAGFTSADNFEKQYKLPLPYRANNLYTDDLDNDGKPELFLGSFDMSFVPVLKNNSDPGNFEFEEYRAPDSTPERFSRYLSQDLNQDGWRDILSYSSSDNASVSVFENKSTSSGITIADPVVLVRGYSGYTIQPGDINGDGKVDLLLGFKNGIFMLLENKSEPSRQLSESLFEKFAEYGVNNSSVSNLSSMCINDLNGDGRPEVINTFSYNTFPHKGYQMEIWQNSPNDCLDPSLISLQVSNYTATILLPPNTSLDQFEIEYASSYASYWFPVSSAKLTNLSPGQSYKLRARARCYLGFTEYYYIDFTTECVDTNSFSVGNIEVDKVMVSAYNLSSLEVQYSPAGKDEWLTLPRNSHQILNLKPGTTYDLRFRGRCHIASAFKYKQFTTVCPKLTALTIGGLLYNSAVASATSNYAGNAILEYSADNANWITIDETGIMFPLIPATQYFVRGKLACTDINSDFIYKSFTTPCPTVSRLSVDMVTPFSATISWVDESDTDSYTLSFSMTAGGIITTVETNSTSFDIHGLNPGTEYTVAIAPECIRDKDFTSIIFTTVCYAPFSLSANSITHTSAELSWNDDFGGLPYFVDYTISGNNTWQTTETALTHLLLTELRPGTEYEARVHINCLSVSAPYVSLLFETHLYEKTTFAPNPTENKMTIYPSTDLIGKHFRILDTAGRILASSTLLDYTIDLSVFSPGIYTLQIEGEIPMRIMKH